MEFGEEESNSRGFREPMKKLILVLLGMSGRREGSGGGGRGGKHGRRERGKEGRGT
jgi:hypothetical protein